MAASELHTALMDTSTERYQREVAVGALTVRASRLRVADRGLCFGRIDATDGRRAYIGRVGLFDEQNDYTPLLVDWRAPVARPFYCATAVNPEGVARRRHFHTRGRDLVEFHDDLFGMEGHDSALVAALNAPRGDTMSDIVATIQAEQDEAIRLDPGGVVVIEGGPGTGKTAVALHRVAYLLYTQRKRLSRWSVLVVGPNRGFLRYIGDVLPSLGETDVVFTALGELMPGLSVTAADPPDTKRVKGSLAMVDVLAAAVADRQAALETPYEIELDDGSVWLDQDTATVARDRARATGLPHNQAQGVFREAVIDVLTRRVVERIGGDWLRPGEVDGLIEDLTADVRFELAGNAGLRAAVDELWPLLTPERLLADLFSSRTRLACAVHDEDDRAALYRPVGDAWTVSDVPLLDEAAEFLGAYPVRRRERDGVEYARRVMRMLELDREEQDEEFVLRAEDLLDPESLAERHDERDHRELAERAAADREWTYGHVVVDEAQELSEMDWRIIMRRCPSRSMTIVGDLAQRRSPAGAVSWATMIDRYVPGRWTYRELTICYRTPAEIMRLASAVLAEVNPILRPPVPVRRNGIEPWTRLVDPAGLAAAIDEATRVPDGGSVAVIGPDGLDVGRAILTPGQAKGLEFDTVVLVEPQRILAARPHGAADLYVALTRATQRLGLLHTEPLPAVLENAARERATIA
ncbi:helicase [Actinosynnema sp. ALI-1.44]|nr:helicase [Actinosynnema sp. ALI-1.44]